MFAFARRKFVRRVAAGLLSALILWVAIEPPGSVTRAYAAVHGWFGHA